MADPPLADPLAERLHLDHVYRLHLDGANQAEHRSALAPRVRQEPEQLVRWPLSCR
jgi:hypothetical protein